MLRLGGLLLRALMVVWVLAIAVPAAAQQAEDADALNAQVVRLYQAGKYAEAIPIAERVLAIREKALGPDHPDVATSLNNLAELYRAQGRTAQAEPLYRRALVVYEKALGPEHPLVATALNNLAGLYRAQGRTAQAEPLYRRALAVYEKALGPEHPDVATALNNLAWLALARNDLAGAAESWRRSTAIIERRAQRGLGGTLEGSSKGEAQRNSWYFSGLVKVPQRLVAEGRGNAHTLTMEMFKTAQWAMGSEAAASLAQMAARSATGSPALAGARRARARAPGPCRGMAGEG